MKGITPMKHDLECRKLELEIDDLTRSEFRTRISMWQAVLTGALTLAVAAGGWIVQSKFDTQDVAEKARDHADELYSRALEEFGSTNASERAGGTRGLEIFANDPSDKARQRAAILMLATRLSNESDAAELGVLDSALVEIGMPALQDVADANRRASLDLSWAVGRYVGLTLRRRLEADRLTRHVANLSNSMRAAFQTRPTFTSKLDVRIFDEAARVRGSAMEHLEQLALPHGSDSQNMSPRQILSVPYLRKEFQDSASVADALESSEGGKNELSTALSEMDQRATALAATSNALSDLLKNLPAKTQSIPPLRRVVLLSAEFDEKDFSTADFRDAYISGSAVKLSCEFCDLRGAELSQLYLSGADLHGANLLDSVLKNLVEDGIGSTPQLPDLSAANWWDAKIDFRTGASTESVAQAYPRGAESRRRNDEMTKFLLANKASSLHDGYRPSTVRVDDRDATVVRLSYTPRTVSKHGAALAGE